MLRKEANKKVLTISELLIRAHVLVLAEIMSINVSARSEAKWKRNEEEMHVEFRKYLCLI